MNLDPNELSKWNCILEPKTNGINTYSGLYIGDIDCAKDQYLLQKLQIRAVLSVIDFPEINLPEQYIHSKISIPDSEDQSLLDHFPLCFNFIDENRKHTNVMVHCYAGISRSATVVLGYLMQHFEWNFDRAYQILWCLRKQILPNEGFIKQLRVYEQILKKENDINNNDYKKEISNNSQVTRQNQFLKQIEQEIEERQRNLEILKQKYKQIQSTKLISQQQKTIL
ncbi:unnamed protein product [Paramecium primaurelia]|uniref:protein-tyrosine-phosphatase n=1 Tax=Paramecium primaurelia TaxID=5886 RepID=A0A8S1JZE2_PARPR|nr:unnamed protein product [Paramecium primaurelia]